MIHRFLIFGGSYYYPSGGTLDLLTAHWDKEAAIATAKANLKESGVCDWTHVFDLETVDIIWSSDSIEEDKEWLERLQKQVVQKNIPPG